MNAELQTIKDRLAEQMPTLRDHYGVASLSLFGSYVRGEQSSDSDVDVLVTFYRTPGLLGFIELENHLSDLLQKKVDLVLKDALKPAIGTRVLAEAVPI
jgi:predicted nucleotidyltransferase